MFFLYLPLGLAEIIFISLIPRNILNHYLIFLSQSKLYIVSSNDHVFHNNSNIIVLERKKSKTGNALNF